MTRSKELTTKEGDAIRSMRPMREIDPVFVALFVADKTKRKDL